MSWEAEQERPTRQARLYAANPEAVFEELKRLSRRSQIDLFADRGEKIEPLLLERNDPLINLGLACYGTNRDVFKALYIAICRLVMRPTHSTNNAQRPSAPRRRNTRSAAATARTGGIPAGLLVRTRWADDAQVLSWFVCPDWRARWPILPCAPSHAPAWLRLCPSQCGS
jgi:hypothetical protein